MFISRTGSHTALLAELPIWKTWYNYMSQLGSSKQGLDIETTTLFFNGEVTHQIHL